jgi:hypothetical protein
MFIVDALTLEETLAALTLARVIGEIRATNST